jgi:hypothetical protein
MPAALVGLDARLRAGRDDAVAAYFVDSIVYVERSLSTVPSGSPVCMALAFLRGAIAVPAVTH